MTQIPTVHPLEPSPVERSKGRVALEKCLPPGRELDGTQSIHRALRIVRLLANNTTSGMRLVEIADGVHLHHSTTHRILRALEQEGIVERIINSRRYTIGSEVVWLGLGASSRFPIATAAAPALDRLSELVEDAVFLSVRSGNDSICADRRIGSYPIQVLSIAIGSRRPLGVSQGGRVILAFLPERISQQVIAANAIRYSQYEITSRALMENMTTARSQGYICSDGVTVKGTRVIAVPVFDVAGQGGCGDQRHRDPPPIAGAPSPCRCRILEGRRQRDFASVAHHHSEPHAPKSRPGHEALRKPFTTSTQKLTTAFLRLGREARYH